jgi:hypothetical protein
MKKIVLTYGLISGAIAALMTLASVPLVSRLPFEYLTVIGYTIFVISFLMVFFGIRAYRETVGGGVITFGRAFKVGILITLVSCVIYVLSWELIHRNFLPDFLENYGNYMVEKERAAGATQERLNALMKENQQFIEMYRNPLIRLASSMMEAFPVGLLMTLICAWVLRTKEPKRGGETGARLAATKPLFTLVAYAALMASATGQDPKDSVKASGLGPEHANLAAFVGTWELTVEGVKEKGSAQIKSILGGRFITEDVKIPFGTFDMEWHGVLGYDRVKKQYTGVWFDNMANTTESGSGEADKTGRILSFRGEHAGPGGGPGPGGGRAKFLWRISNDGKKAMTIEMFEVAKDGKETLAMKVHGEKQK